MANPYNNGQVTWNANEINAARDWFSAGKSATDTQARANELGLSNTQLENLWNVSMGPNGGTNPFTRSTTATQATGATTTQGTGASHPDLTQTVYNTPNGITDGSNPYPNTRFTPTASDPYGVNAYNQHYGLLRTPYIGANDQLVTSNDSATIGVQRGNQLYPLLSTFNAGIDPNAVYRSAGLATPSGSYSGQNGSWVPASGASDTLEARNARIAALQAAGLSASDAWREANNGFWQPEDPNAPNATTPRYDARGNIIPGTSGQSGGASGLSGVNAQPAGAGGMLSQSVNMGNGQWNVTPDQLVENRLQNLLDDDNPLVQMARTQGLQDAQSRGLLNSSLGAQAGALAAYQYAMPVAQQDATTYGNAARTNAENAVQMQMQQAGFGHDADMARINEGVQSRLSAQGAQQELARLNQVHRNTLSQTSVQQQNWMQQSYLSQMNNYQNSLAQYTQRIQEADMPADQKTAQINELMQTYSNLINWSNASYGQMPQWVSQWSTLAPTIESR